MGPEPGRNAALSAALAETLAAVAAALADSRAPWWVIGSAAVILHGGRTDARDVDVLLSQGDAEQLAIRLALPNLAGDGDARFRSAKLLRWTAPPLAVEFMAVLEVNGEGGWHPVRPRSRVPAGGVYVPDEDELAAILVTFGRHKDLARAALLRPSRGRA